MSSLLGEKLKNCLAEKNCYEAHQIYRTMYFRLARANKFIEAYDRMFEGAMNMFEMQEPLSGVDLANLLLDLLNKDNAGQIIVDTKKDAVYTDIGTLFDHILPDSQDRDAFVVKVLSTPCLSSGKDVLRTKFANVYWKEQNYSQARKHFLYSSESGDKVATFLIEYQVSKSIPEEIDLMIAQFVLQCLVLKRFELGRTTFFNYVEKHPQIGQNKPNFMAPLLNFLYFLLEAPNQKNEAELPKTFMALCKLYESSIERDSDFQKYLETIGHNYFGLPKPAKSNDDNPLASLMRSLLGDGTSTNSSSGPSGMGNSLFQQMLAPRGSGASASGGRPIRSNQNASSSAPVRQPQAPTDDDLD